MSRDSFVDFIVDQLRLLGPVTTKPMAGGYRLFRDRIPFGYVRDGRVYFATTELTRRSFEEHEMGAYRETDSPQLVNYFEVPPDVVDDPETLAGWARVALAPSNSDYILEDEELVDIINDNDEVVGRTPLAEAYAAHTPHRIVHVLVENTQGALALQFRSRSKKYMPAYWTTSASGHVSSGETYEEAAVRELQEELGIAAPLVFVGKYWFASPDGFRLLLAVFRTTYDGPLYPNPSEVDHAAFFTPAQIVHMIATHEPMTPGLLFLLQRLGSLTSDLPAAAHQDDPALGRSTS